MDLALNNLQRLICHKTQPTKPNQTMYSYVSLTIQLNISHLFTHIEMNKQFYFWQSILA